MVLLALKVNAPCADEFRYLFHKSLVAVDLDNFD